MRSGRWRWGRLRVPKMEGLTQDELLDPWALAEKRLGIVGRLLLEHIDVRPHPRQLELLARGLGVWRMIVTGGFQSGKSYLTALFFLLRWLTDKTRAIPIKERVYWVVGNTRGDYKKEQELLWDWFHALYNGLTKPEGRERHPVKESDRGTQWTLWDGSVIRFKYMAKWTEAKQDAPLGIIACEAGQLNQDAYVELERRADAVPGWMLLSGTYDSIKEPWYVELEGEWGNGAKPGCEAHQLHPGDNLTLYPGGRDDPKLEAMRRNARDLRYEERVEGRPEVTTRLVYWRFKRDVHVSRAPDRADGVSGLYIEEAPVYIWCDQGFGDAYALLAVQHYDETIWVFDEVYKRRVRPSEIIGMVKTRAWWANGRKFLALDPNNAAADYGFGTHRAVWEEETGLIDQWRTMKVRDPRTGQMIPVKKPNILPAQETLNDYLKLRDDGSPQLVIDPRCRGLLSEFGSGVNPIEGGWKPYVFKVNARGEATSEPLDKHNHSVKALAYGLMLNYRTYKLAERVGHPRYAYAAGAAEAPPRRRAAPAYEGYENSRLPNLR